MQRAQQTKPGTPSFVPSKSIITGWLKSLFPDMPLSSKIEDFGDGVVYCRLLNHFYGNPPHSKITWQPKNEYEYANNLKHVQTALLQLGIVIPFDVNRVCKRKFLENWALINSFYKHFNTVEEVVGGEENSASSHGVQAHGLNVNGHVPGSFASHQPIVNQPKTHKRPHPVIPHHSQLQPQPQPRHYPQIPQPSLWQHNLPLNFHPSLQYLKQNVNIYNSSPSKGKWSVGSQMFQNNNNAVIDRVKEILLKGSHDTEKIRQIKMLLGMPVEEEEVIKIQDDQGMGPIVYERRDKDERVEIREIKEVKEVKEEKSVEKDKELQEMLQRQCSSTKEPKQSVSKSGRKPFKI